jgi:hypothetical protein
VTQSALRDAWDEARALVRPPMRRDAARAALLRVLTLAAPATNDDEAREIRIDAETTLLVVESGGTPTARKRAQAAWLAFARRRLRAGETLQNLAQMMNAVGVTTMRPAFARAFRDAWSEERLDALAEQGPRSDRTLRAQWRTTLVPKDPALAYRFAYESLRNAKWTHAVSCARVAEQQHKTITTRENARLVLLAALHRARKRDVTLACETIASFVDGARRRKVWMFDWRTLAALAIAHDVRDAALLSALADAWRRADPTFAATPLLGTKGRRP